MSKIKFGCQTYSWQMSYDIYSGQIAHISEVMSKAGFQGMEAELCMLGDRYWKSPEALKECLDKKNIQFAALALPLPWINDKETDEERETAERAIRFVQCMTGSILVLCHLPEKNRFNLKERQKNQIQCVRAVAERAHEKGVITAFHPNSSEGSVFRTADDYEILMDGIANSSLGFAPDVGHIAHGDMNPLEVLKKYREKIKHVHFKDMDNKGVWRAMGKGNVDFSGIVSYLKDTEYEGWIVIEEESADAEKTPDQAAYANGRYLDTQIGWR